MKSTKNLSKTLKVGINFSIILNSACYIEGVLETGLKALLCQKRNVFNKILSHPNFYIRKTTNQFFNKLEEDLEGKISRTTGLSNYDDVFNLLIGKRPSKFPAIAPMWEGLKTLFHFRNVISHGKEVSGFLLSAYWIDEPWKESFRGGYKKAEEYFLKNNLVKKRFIESESERMFFSNRVASHFWKLAQDFVKNLSNSLSGEEKKAFDEAVFKGNIFFRPNNSIQRTHSRVKRAQGR